MISFSQFFIKDTGVTIITFLAKGSLSVKGFYFNNVQIKPIAYKVFPNPIESAKIQPFIYFSSIVLNPHMHSNINFTPYF